MKPVIFAIISATSYYQLGSGPFEISPGTYGQQLNYAHANIQAYMESISHVWQHVHNEEACGLSIPWIHSSFIRSISADDAIHLSPSVVLARSSIHHAQPTEHNEPTVNPDVFKPLLTLYVLYTLRVSIFVLAISSLCLQVLRYIIFSLEYHDAIFRAMWWCNYIFITCTER